MISMKLVGKTLGVGRALHQSAALMSCCPPPPICPDKVLEAPTGIKLPIIGLGTHQLQDVCTAEPAIRAALDKGYRHFDLSPYWKNEGVLGEVFEKIFCEGCYKREQLFITSKLPFTAMNQRCVKEALCKTLQCLRMNYLDLYLMNFPVGAVKEGCGIKADPCTDHPTIWKAMECQVKECKVKFIGLSNFNRCQIEKIMKCAEIMPSNLQIELNAYIQQAEMREFARCKCITLTAYSALGSNYLAALMAKACAPFCPPTPPLLEHPCVCEIATRICKTPAQVLLRFMLQLDDIALIPADCDPCRIQENIAIFDFCLTDEDMCKLKNLDKCEAGRQFNKKVWSVTIPGSECHSEYPFET